MASTQPTPNRRSVARWGARAQVVASTAQREFVYQWTAPRSPTLRVFGAPLFLGAALIAVLIGMLALVLMLIAAAIVVIVLAAASILQSTGTRLGLWRQRTHHR